MARRSLALIFVAALAWIPQSAGAQDPSPDQISKLLFDAYIARPGKINTDTVMAAAHIIAERGRASGFWKEVLAELQSDEERSEVNCVRILGKMLAIDASARDAIRRHKETGEVTAWVASVELGPEVASELLKRGQKADRFRVDHYAIALARARVPEARAFFQSILRGQFAKAEKQGNTETAPTGRALHLDSTRIHAAVGLAQLGDPEGIEWLIAHCEDIQGDVSHARPYGASSGSLGSCCVAALRQLSEQRDLTTKAQWEAWLKTADAKRQTIRVVQFADP